MRSTILTSTTKTIILFTKVMIMSCY